MVKYFFLLAGLFVSNILYSQIGIGTSIPEATLDTNGNVRIQTIENIPGELGFSKDLMVIDNGHQIRRIDQSSITGVDEIKSRVIAILPKKKPQLLAVKGVSNSVSFDDGLSGINITAISLADDNKTIIFPPNRVFKITGYLGVKGRKEGADSGDAPAYISNKFELMDSPDTTLVFSTYGFGFSSTLLTDEGSYNPSTILFASGNTSTKVQLMAQYGGENAPETEYYISGEPTNKTLGSYIIIEEIR